MKTNVHCALSRFDSCRQVDVEKAQTTSSGCGVCCKFQEELQCFRSEVSDNIPDSSVLLTEKKARGGQRSPQRRYEQAKVRFTTEERIGKRDEVNKERYECLDQAYDVALKLQNTRWKEFCSIFKRYHT